MSKLYETYNKFNEAMTATKVRVFCRICYANIWEPKSILGSEPKFSVSCLFDKEDKLMLRRSRERLSAGEARFLRDLPLSFPSVTGIMNAVMIPVMKARCS